MHFKVGDGSWQKVQSQRLPVVAIIKRDKNAGIGSGIEQAFAFGILADHARHLILGKAVYDFLPCVTVIVSAQNVSGSRFAGGADGDVSSASIMVRGLDIEDLQRLFYVGRRDVVPMRSGIARDVNQPVSGAGP